jgi:ribose transport system substrate-binding protein
MTPPQEDGQVQAQRIQQAVNDGVNAILISVSDAAKVTGAINEAVDRGVHVMTFDSDAPQSKRFSFYGVDDEQTGVAILTELLTLTGPNANVAILAGNQNATNLQARVKGIRDEAAKHSGVTIVGAFNHTETAQDATAEVVRVNNAYPTVNAWAMVGGWPLFAQSLLTDIDSARMKIVAIDALPVQLVYVERGIAPVLLAQPVYEWGNVGVRTIVDKIRNNVTPPVMIPMELVRVTRESLGQWARQLRDWGFTDVDSTYINMN